MELRNKALQAFAAVDTTLDDELSAADTIERRLLICFVAVVASLLILGALIFQATTRHAESLFRAVYVKEIRASLANIRAELSKAESRNRAYVITGERSYLAGNDHALQTLQELKQKLRDAASREDLPVGQDIADEIGARIVRRLDLFRRLAALHDMQPDETSEIVAVIETGNREFEAIEALTQEAERRFTEAENREWATTRRRERRMIALYGVMTMAMTFFLALMFWQIRLEVRQRKGIQQHLLDREKSLQEVLRAAVDGIIVIDTRGIVQSINPAAERIFGYAPSEVVGRNIKLLMPEPYRSEHDGYLEHYLRTGEKRIIGIGRDVAGMRKDGRVFPMELAVGETRSGGERRFIGTVRDISTRKQTEREQKKLLADLFAANEELRRFSYVISHDLKAPLRAIGSLAAWLMEDYGGKLGDEGNRQIELLVGRVQRMDRLIDGILAYSRAGRSPETPAMADAGEALADAIGLIEIPDNMQVKVETPLPRLAVEQVRLQQVFQNLIGNAVKHANAPGAEIRIGCTEMEDAWRFHVCDNGPGIDPRNFERIFQLFQTLVPKDTSENTGVGLAIVKKIVELYGGKVWVESEMGKGACFLFTLPRLPPADERKAEVPHADR
ncbi:PAS domain S-box protein [Noviherbaspirillum sp.]|uniref:sensor histidine kinase n=1 Tax=Noviherbaspirillum sp. TaxID=1926288 RepID=UPI002B46D227|nr:PAS domain S-box protein [Noviherbaspirillum sp.]HJV79399.1 PAS domain S-box protein [Noviherbaspirillum sp.]